MTVRIWMGEPADEGYERSALKELASSVADERDDFEIFANFTVGTGRESKQIDLLVIQEKSWSIIELKHSAGYAVFGKSNGLWKRSDGHQFPGHNPALQVVKQYSVLKAWLHKNHRDFIEQGRQAACRELEAWSDIRKFIALYPCLNPSSKIDVSAHQGFAGTLGAVIGFDLVKEHLLEPKWQGSLRMELESGEIEKLAGLLGLANATARVLVPKPTTVSSAPATGSGNKKLASLSSSEQEPAETEKKRLFGGRLMFCAVLLALCALIAYYIGAPHLQKLVEAPDAWRYIVSEDRVTVRLEISRIAVNGWDRIIYDRRIPFGAEHNFSFEINSVGDAQLPFEATDTILIGPVPIGTSDRGNAQIEISYSDVDKLVRKER
jgi:hypothetical protein